ncbi:MAG: 50S ribosome-binding GTPase [Planctomycetes bacterium]|nr:50S ribosome-binding GTPase [Planctomycetota bacterium]
MTSTYAWLTSPGASALALLWLGGADARRFVERRGGRVSATPSHAWLKGESGAALDEVVIAQEEDGLVISCHGGMAVRNAFNSELERAGLRQTAATALFGARSPYRREMLALLSRCPGELAARCTLYALNHGEQLLASALARYTPASLARVASASACAKFLYEPPRVQLWGAVNSGKSTLLNALCGESLAAAGDEPGLTRDVVEGRFECMGACVRVFDAPGEFAGVPEREIDREAIKLARRWRDEADLTLILAPARELRAGRKPEVDGKAVIVASRFDEDPDVELGAAGGVSNQDASTIQRLREWLVRHFLGPLIELDAGDRFALSYGVRLGLTRVAEGSANAADMLKKWVG